MNHKNLLRALGRYKSFLISTHVNPDIDALASEIALAKFLKSLKKKVVIVNGDHVPAMYRFLPGISQVKAYSRAYQDFEAAVILDCGDLDRIKKIRKLIKDTTIIINIDHHITNDHFGTLNLVDVKASSTAEVIFNLLKEARYSLSKTTAMLLYLGIMTDTGSFRYENTTAHTFGVASELMKFRLPVNVFYRKIYETVPWSDLKAIIKIIQSAEMTLDGRCAMVTLSQRDIKTFSGQFDLREIGRAHV